MSVSRAAVAAMILAGLLLSAAAGLRACRKASGPDEEAKPRRRPELVREDPAAGAPQEPVALLESGEFRPEIERRIFELTNQERARRGLGELAWNAEAAKAARYQSRCLSRRGLLGHDTVPCGSLRGRLDLFEIVFPGSENLDFIEVPGRLDETILNGKPVVSPGGPPPAQVLGSAIVQHWLDSPRHRDNLLDREHTDLGVGVHWAEGRIYSTQVFLRKTDCGVSGQLCCFGANRIRYCFHPYECEAATDVCRRP